MVNFHNSLIGQTLLKGKVRGSYFSVRSLYPTLSLYHLFPLYPIKVSVDGSVVSRDRRA